MIFCSYSSAILPHSTELQGSLLIIQKKKSSVVRKRESLLILQPVITTFTQKHSVHF